MPIYRVLGTVLLVESQNYCFTDETSLVEFGGHSRKVAAASPGDLALGPVDLYCIASRIIGCSVNNLHAVFVPNMLNLQMNLQFLNAINGLLGSMQIFSFVGLCLCAYYLHV